MRRCAHFYSKLIQPTKDVFWRLQRIGGKQERQQEPSFSTEINIYVVGNCITLIEPRHLTGLHPRRELDASNIELSSAKFDQLIPDFAITTPSL
jgi:hypothetical protein